MATQARLVFGDKGFVPWNMAKYRFITEVHIELRREFGIEDADLHQEYEYLHRVCPDIFAVRTYLV